METKDIILILGIVLACIWMLACILMEGKARKYVIIAGVVLDAILFAVSRNCELLLGGVVCGLAIGLLPTLVSRRKYDAAVCEMRGVKNWTGVAVIFAVMIFLVIALAYPEMKITW